MSNYHILAGRPDGNQLRVVFHLSVPDEVNSVGTNYHAALAMHLGGEQLSAVPASLLGAGEQTALNNGELYEVVWAFDTNPEMTLLDKRDILDAKYMDFASGIISQLQIQLGYYGYGRDVP